MSTILILALLLAAPSTAATATSPKHDELIENYVAATEAAQKRHADEIAAAKKVRDDRIARAEKALRAERDAATQKYLASAEKSATKYADAMKTAIAATVAAYDGMIERTRRAGQAEASAAAAEAKKNFSARALEDNRRNTAAARALAGITTGPGGEPASATTTTTTTAVVDRGPVIADHVIAAVDDFIIDVYHNGEKVPDTSRRLLNEIHGATVERVDVEIRRGDWVVFNVANNRLRWGGQSLFIAAGMLNEGQPPAFVTRENDQHWSVCDDPGQVKKFIAERTHMADQPARAPESPWGEGIGHFNAQVPNSEAQPIWGESRNTWIKFVAE
jgi:hypothetical protein